MTAKILDGKALAHTIQEELKLEVDELIQKDRRPPGLAVILIGKNAASEIYVANKRKACDKVGIRSFAYDLEETVSEKELLDLIEELNHNDSVDGILVQLPLPKHINSDRILEHIDPAKDVDGFHPYNLGRVIQCRPLLRPCTAYGIMTLLQRHDIFVPGLNAVCIGASTIVGRPTALELLLRNATVTVCHKLTKNLKEFVELADLLIVATGTRFVVDPQWIKPGAIVVDVGIHRLPDGKISGDLDFDAAAKKASWITPVPGGVGPMTVTMLLVNTIFAYRNLTATKI